MIAFHDKTGPHSFAVDRIVNCTGPKPLAKNSEPLIRSLLDQGIASLDALGIGFHTDEQGRILDAANRMQNMYAIGPLRKGQLWENTAVPELRKEARELARTVISDLRESLFS